MSEFLAMGGYGGFVWSAYGLAVFVMAGLAVSSWRRQRRLSRDAAQLRAARRQRRTAVEGA